MHRSALAVLIALALPAAAFAQMPAPAPGQNPAEAQANMARMMTLGAYNQLGVLEYCQSQGHIGPETVALQQKMIGMLPTGAAADGSDAAEATGKTGVVSFGGNQTSLEDAAKAQNTTVALLCGKLAAALTQAAKSLPQ